MVRLYQVILKSDKIRAQMTQMGCWNKLSSYLDNMIQYILKGGCFAAGTLVMTAQGMVPIETVTPGTWVLSASEHGGVREYRQVVETFTTHPDALIEVRVKAESGLRAGALPETILSTEEHPFYVLDEAFTASEGNGHVSPPGTWRGASALHAGDRVWLSSGEVGMVSGVRRLAGDPNHTLTTYNFEVSEHHTYFVGRTGVWVHNSCTKAVDWALDRLKLPGYDKVLPGGRTSFLRNWALNQKNKPDQDALGMLLHHAHMTDMGDLHETEYSLSDLISLTNQRGLKHSQVRALLDGSVKADTQGKWDGHHIFPRWLMDDLGITGVDADDLPCMPLPGGGTAKRHLWAPDATVGSKGFEHMTDGLGVNGKGYDPPFHRGVAPEGLEARLTSIRSKYRNNPGLPKSELLDDLMQEMSKGTHGDMQLHLKFKSIAKSILRAKNPGLIPSGW